MKRASTAPAAARNAGRPLSAAACRSARSHCQLNAGMNGTPAPSINAKSCCRHDWPRQPGSERSQPSPSSRCSSSRTMPGSARRSNAGHPRQRTAPAMGTLTYPSEPS